MKQCRCYQNTSKIKVLGVLWHSTGANNPTIKRYVQPDSNDINRQDLLNLIGKNQYNNSWNSPKSTATTNAVIGRLADGSVGTVQCLPWDFRPYGCGVGKKGSCNYGWIQFEIAEDNLKDPDYFNKVYQEAVELTAYLCKLYNLNPQAKVTFKNTQVPVILCHADAHKLGLASNHGDILHWFKLYNKTMQDVRNDVEKILREDDEEVTQEEFNKMMDVYLQEKSKEPTSDWAQEVMNWATKEGILVGDQYGNLQAQKFITRQECVTLMNRLFNKIK